MTKQKMDQYIFVSDNGLQLYIYRICIKLLETLKSSQFMSTYSSSFRTENNHTIGVVNM